MCSVSIHILLVIKFSVVQFTNAYFSCCTNFSYNSPYLISWKSVEQFFSSFVKKVKCPPVQALRLCTGRTAHRGSRGIALLFLDHGARRGWGGQRHAPATVYPQERPGTHCTGGWVGPRAGLDRCGKSRPLPISDPRPVQPVASRYTDYATRPTSSFLMINND